LFCFVFVLFFVLLTYDINDSINVVFLKDISFFLLGYPIIVK